MKLLLFSTQRQIREWLQNFNNTTLEKHSTIGEFLQNIIVVKDKKFIDNEIRKIYLFEAIKNIDITNLGFKKEFMSFSKDSDFIFGFLKEIFMEKVDIDDIIISDTYVEYEEHLKVIKEIKEKYKNILEKNGYIDTFLIENYEINQHLLDGIDEIEVNLDGYFSKFELEIFEKIDRKIIFNFNVSPFNQPLLKKMFKSLEIGYKYVFDFKNKEILNREEITTNSEIEVSYFSKKFDEINFVFAKIAQFVEAGLDPDKIAVILPDETFSEFLEEFDEYKNLNFAMGKSFTHSNLFIKLKALNEYFVNQDEVNRLKSLDWLEEFEHSDLLEFIRNKANNKELKVIDEELFKLESFRGLFENKKQFLHFILEKFKELKFDDVYSGKITTMGVLESRGIDYDGVILVNFNEGVVPNVNNKDLFLNSSIRKKAKLPTRTDKENLQKHYYYSLIQNSKKVAISYVQNDVESVSRFLYQMDLELGQNEDERYKEVLYKYSNKKQLPFYDENFQVKEPITPTSLKMVMECPKKYYFNKVLNIKNENEEDINFGTVFHNILEEAVKNKHLINSSQDYFETIMNGIFQNLNSRKEIYDIRIKYEDSIKKFCEIDYEQMKYSTQIIERFLEFSFCDKRLTSKVDRVDINETTITLIDYKTGKLDKLLKHPYEFQLTFYYLYAKEKYPQKKVIIGYWDILNGKFIETKPKVEELRDVLNNLPNKVKMAEDICVDEKIIKKSVDICKWCEYNMSCGRD